MKMYCGIDLGDKFTLICVCDETGKMVKERSLPTDPGEMKTFLKKYKGAKCVVEASPLSNYYSLE